MQLPEGLVCFVKAECPTCQTVQPVLRQLQYAGLPLTVFTQDDPGFPAGVRPVDDTALELSYREKIEIVPTLLRVQGGRAIERLEGWDRREWERFTGRDHLGDGLPDFRPGCGSRTLDPGMPETLSLRYDGSRTRSRRIALGPSEDEVEAMYARGWSDGLPLVPPTPRRVLRMLEGTARAPDEVVAVVPPDLAECTVEKVAINAVMAGCRPEYLPVVLAALEAACTDEFNIHGVLATTYFVGPVVIVNGPIATEIGMNSGVNALGQGNRANATIGRALQLVIRNIGGGRPGEIDRATLGNPGKYTFCFAEAEETSPWEPLAVERGLPAGRSAVTVFAGAGVQPMFDQLARTPEALARSLASCLRVVGHPKWGLAWNALCVISPEHGRVFREAGWSRQRLRAEIDEPLTFPGAEMVKGAGGMAEGMPESVAGTSVRKFDRDALLFAHAGGTAGLFSAIIAGWISGLAGSQPVTREVHR
ncbi:MAG: thioredoxin family protein [Candidatus Dormibacteraeota bacterium]|nr:thioredoxin family protein [Candidatus Dormibacteraeota bacterium]